MTTDNREKHIERIKGLIRGFDDSCDGIIYHYTTAEGFQGIIQNCELWLTNTEFVNDITECRALHEEAKKGLLNENDLSNNPYVKKWWREIFQYDTERQHNYYVASFSKKGDDLNQLRAYGRFCIGFEAQKLKTESMKLYECVYDSETIKKWIIDKSNAKEWELSEPDRTKHYTGKDGVSTTLYDDWRDAAAFDLIYKASIKYKNKNYENEEEMRLVTVSNHDWGFYTKSGPSLFRNDAPIHFRFHPAYKLPVPYVKFFIPKQTTESDLLEDYEDKNEQEIKRIKHQKEKSQKRLLLPIKKIWIGPGPHESETKLACEILLKEKGYKDVQIKISEIPYRGF